MSYAVRPRRVAGQQARGLPAQRGGTLNVTAPSSAARMAAAHRVSTPLSKGWAVRPCTAWHPERVQHQVLPPQQRAQDRPQHTKHQYILARHGARALNNTTPSSASRIRSCRLSSGGADSRTAAPPLPRRSSSCRQYSEAWPASAEAAPTPSIPTAEPSTGVAHETRHASPAAYKCTLPVYLQDTDMLARLFTVFTAESQTTAGKHRSSGWCLAKVS